MVEMKPVISGNISAVGWERGTLHVAFKTGGKYSYVGVPEKIYKAFLTAASKGTYFAKHIRDKFPTTRLP